jgi:acyl-CoA synthetase (AMP-forming)/AMP-acid ligase II
MNTNFYRNIDTTLRQFPVQEVVVWPAEYNKDAISTTGKELLDRIATIGNALQKNGIRNGEKVMLLLPVGFELISSLLAVMAIGSVPILPPAAISKTGLLQLLRKGNINAVITAKQPGFFAAALLKLLKVRLVNTAEIKTTEQEWLQPEIVNPEQAALISHSSGSTGQPKAIYRSHRVLQAQHEALKQAFPPFEGQIDFPLFPNILLHNLAIGVKSVLPAIPGFDLTKMNPAAIASQLQQEKVNTLTGNVYYFRKLLQYLKENPQQFLEVSALGIGGSPVPENLVKELQKFFPKADIFIIYGSSEAEPIAIRKVNNAVLSPESGYNVGPVISSLESKIEASGEVKLRNGKTYHTGEILVRGNHVATLKNNWLRTGDFGYLNEEKELILTGRQNNEKIHLGVQHYQIEHALQQVAGVHNVAAKSLPTGFTVYVQGNATEKQLREKLTENFPAEIVKEINFRNALPVDARHHSKIQYANLN